MPSRRPVYLFSTLSAGSSIEHSLGAPEYSYHFVLEGYRAALKDTADIVVLASAVEVEHAHAEFRRHGREAIFLCFTPPHRVPLSLVCPTVCVFAWEFTTVPAECCNDQLGSDWTHVWQQTGRTLTLSNHAAGLVREAMGSGFDVASLPAPVAERHFAALPPTGGARILTLRGSIFDSRVYGPYFGRPLPLAAVPLAALPAALPSAPSPPRLLGWYRRWVRDRWLPAGSARALSVVGRWWAARTAPVTEPPAPLPEPACPAGPPPERVRLDGIVYASVFNPMDGRKNWQDLLTAFCYAFRDEPGATLVMKMVHEHREAFEILLDRLTYALSPFQCRVVALHGWMTDAEYDALIAAADYYVNTSTGEGQCLPLMEFMAAGRPAIAPDHTAMADYVDASNSFVLTFSEEYNVWPHDERDLFRTMRYRLDWGSLHDAFQDSYRQFSADPAAYAAMARSARSSAAKIGSADAFPERLADFLAAA